MIHESSLAPVALGPGPELKTVEFSSWIIVVKKLTILVTIVTKVYFGCSTFWEFDPPTR